jgi:gamma-glutamyltranspeptidase / glutathione hydrolase
VSIEIKNSVSATNIAVRKILPEKPLVNSTRFMVSTPHELASRAGKKMLDKGGSAADAAIASHLVLSVTTPEATGIGGGGFINVYDKKKDKPIIYDARETAPHNISETEFTDDNGNTPSYLESIAGGRTVGVPGILKGLKELHDAHGKLPWKELFVPAIDVATNGFEMSKRLHLMLQKQSHYSRLSEQSKRYFRPDGSLKSVGDIIKNPELAKTLKEISDNGIDSFYTGRIAQDIVDTATKTSVYPSKMSLDDLKNYKTIKRKPAEIDYKNFRIYVPPSPSSGGIAVLQSLKLLEPFEIEKYDADDLRTETLVNNAIRLAYRDRNDVIGDPDFVKVDEKKLLSKEYLKPRQTLLSTSSNALTKDDKPYDAKNLNVNTSHSSFIDTEGNGVSITSSVQHLFGSGLETQSGFVLNSTLSDFTLDGYKTNSPNKIAPNKRPRSAMCPVIVKNIDTNELRLLIGSPGGTAIIAFLVRRMIDILDYKIPIHKAVSRPNYIPSSDDATIKFEKDLITDKEKDYFKQHNFDASPEKLFVSGFQVVEKDAGFLSGASDPRRDGVAIGG